jgi:hypothetical protein
MKLKTKQNNLNHEKVQFEDDFILEQYVGFNKKESIKIVSGFSFFKRIFVLITNPFTYIFKGYIKY